MDQEDRDKVGVLRFEVVLEEAEKVYYSGHEITGRIHLDLKEPLEAKCLKLKCKGEAQVFFTDRSAGIRRKFNANEVYLHKIIYLKGDEEGQVAIGSGVYKFTLLLPERIPCSFEGRYGRVRYSTRATLQITQSMRISSNVVPFTLVTVLDLNQEPLALSPLKVEQSKVFAGESEPVTMSAGIPVRGYVPGQTIPLLVALNKPSPEISKLRAVLKKVVVYHASEKSRKHKEIVVEIEQPVELSCQTYKIDVDVPSVASTGMEFCSLIDVRYTLKVQTCLKPSEWLQKILQKNIKLRVNILIGSVPLSDYQTPLVHARDDNDISQRALPLYKKSQVYPSSKPNRDDPTGEDGDSDGEIKAFEPMYRIYKFER